MKPNTIISTLRLAAAVLAAAFSLQTLQATPYASGITNSAGTVSFFLNESNANVTVTFQDGSTNTSFNGLTTGTNLGTGSYSFALGGNTSYNIIVDKVGSGAATQISVDTSTNVNFNSPRGITINNNPKDRYFGLVYMANGQAGGIGVSNKLKAIYIYNADLSDPPFIGTNARARVFTGGNGNSPYRIQFATNNNLYISDVDAARGTVWGFDRDVLVGTNILAGFGDPTGQQNHGRVGSQPNVTGSLAGGDLVLYTTDQSFGPPFNSILKYNIGAGPVPATNLPTVLGNISLPGFGVVQGAQVTDLFRGPDGKFYGCCRRLNFSNPGVTVFDSTGTNILWDSISVVGGAINAGPDLLADLQSISVSPDNKYMGVIYTDSHIDVLKLTNGVPDAGSVFTIQNLPNVGNGRGIAWDAADNLYAISSGQGLLRVYSLGQTTRAITRNDSTGTNGTFEVNTPNTTASVVATTPQASQGSPTPIPGVFTITRTDASNDYSAPLNVGFTLSGTARPGTYNVSGGSVTATNTTFTTNNVVTFTTYPLTATNVVIATNIVVTGSVTILAVETATNITITPVNDGVSRPTNTVILTLKSGGAYSAVAPAKDTVTIKNTGPQFVFISSASAPTMYKRLTNDFGSFVITRWGDVDVSSYAISSLSYAGTAPGAAYVPVGSVTFNPGDVTVTNFITPLIDTTSLVGNRSVIVSLAGGGGYTAGPNTASLTIIDNVNPPATLIYSNALTSADDATNWLVTAANNNMITNAIDNNIVFGYDLTANNPNNTALLAGLITLPPSGATNALRITVNKTQPQGSGAAAGVNLYLTNQIFSGDYEVRFYLNCTLGGNASFTTEGALFGINHTGNGTNWWTGSGIQVGSQTNFNMDGVWYWISGDGGAGAGDYIEYTGLGGTNGNTGSTTLLSKTRTSFTGNFKSPSPYSGVSSGLIGNSSPANALAGGGGYTNAWADVQIKKANNIVTLLINKIPIFTYTNTTVWTNGYLMLGYNDPFSSVGAPDGAAYFSDLQVVALSAPVITLQPSNIVAAAGIPVTFAAKATFGSTALSTNYQWFFNGTAIPGATSTNYSFTAASTNYGTYSWSANDGNVTTVSTNATLTPPLPSIVSVLPLTRASVIGGSGTYTVTAITSSGVTNVQWLSNSVSIASATSRTLTLANVVAGNFGSIYTVRVNDGTTSITSSPPVTLTLATNQTITSPSWATNRFKLSYGTEFGPNYVVELKTNLLQASWTPVSTNAGTGGILNVTNTTSAAQGFYRLRLQ